MACICGSPTCTTAARVIVPVPCQPLFRGPGSGRTKPRFKPPTRLPGGGRIADHGNSGIPRDGRIVRTDVAYVARTGPFRRRRLGQRRNTSDPEIGAVDSFDEEELAALTLDTDDDSGNTNDGSGDMDDCSDDTDDCSDNVEDYPNDTDDCSDDTDDCSNDTDDCPDNILDDDYIPSEDGDETDEETEESINMALPTYGQPTGPALTPHIARLAGRFFPTHDTIYSATSTAAVEARIGISEFPTTDLTPPKINTLSGRFTWTDTGHQLYNLALVDGVPIEEGDAVAIQPGPIATERDIWKSQFQSIVDDPVSGSSQDEDLCSTQDPYWCARVESFIQRDRVDFVHVRWFERDAFGPLGSKRELYLTNRCDEIHLDSVLAKLDVLCLPASDPVPPGNRLFYRFLYMYDEGSFHNVNDDDRLLRDRFIQLPPQVHMRCNGCRYRAANPSNGNTKLQWLLDPGTGEPLVGSPETLDGLAVVVNYETIYRKGDLVTFLERSRSQQGQHSNPEPLYSLGQITDFYGEGGCNAGDKWNLQGREVIDLTDGDEPGLPASVRELLKRAPCTANVRRIKRCTRVDSVSGFSDDAQLTLTGDGDDETLDAIHLVKLHDITGHFRLSIHPPPTPSHPRCDPRTFYLQHCDRWFTPSVARQQLLRARDVTEAAFDATVQIPVNREGFSHIELFSGIGGFSLGFASAGLVIERHTYMIDLDPVACETAAFNYPLANVICADADVVLQAACGQAVLAQDLRTGREITASDLPPPGSVGLLSAGFPCQGHSRANVYRSAKDPRNALAATTLSYIEHFRPQYVLLENVRGFLSTKLQSEGESIEAGFLHLVVRALTSLGYQAQFGLFQAAHFGSPQCRRRLFIWAALRGLRLPGAPQPTHCFKDDFLTFLLKDGLGKPKDIFTITEYASLFPTVTVYGAIADLPPFEYENPETIMQKPASRKRDCDDARDVPQFPGRSGPTVGPEPMPYPYPPANNFQAAMREGLSSDALVNNHVTSKFGDCWSRAVGGHRIPIVEQIHWVPFHPGANLRDLPEELVPDSMREENQTYLPRYAHCYERLDKAGVFPVILTRVDPRCNQGTVLHPGQHRVITVLEAQRAQGIPDRIVVQALDKNNPTREQYRQVGNSVPLQLVQAFAREFRKAMVEDWIAAGKPNVAPIRALMV